jgi:hypothetical protein
MKNAKAWTIIYHIIAVVMAAGLVLTACGEVGNSLAQEGDTMETEPIQEMAMAIPVPPTGLGVTLTISDIPGAHHFYKEVEVEAGKGSFDVFKIAFITRRINGTTSGTFKELDISKTNKFIIRLQGETDSDVIYNSVALILDVANDIEYSSVIETIILQGPDVNHI